MDEINYMKLSELCVLTDNACFTLLKYGVL